MDRWRSAYILFSWFQIWHLAFITVNLCNILCITGDFYRNSLSFKRNSYKNLRLFLLGNIKNTRNIKKYEFIKHIKAVSFFRLTYSHPIIKPLAKIYKTSIANILKKRFKPLHFNVFHLFKSFFSIPNNQNNTYIYQTFNLALLCTIFIPSIGFTRIDSIDRIL